MLNEASHYISQWIKGRFHDVEVYLGPPKSEFESQRIGAYLLDVIPTAPAIGGRKSGYLCFECRYLITAESPEITEAHRVLGDLLIAATLDKQFVVDKEVPPIALWSAFRAPPRPSFFLRFPVEYKIPDVVRPLVQHPPTVKSNPMCILQGIVSIRDGESVGGAKVIVEGLGKQAVTGLDGRFEIPGVPQDAASHTITVQLKGMQTTFIITPDQQKLQPIRLEINAPGPFGVTLPLAT